MFEIFTYWVFVTLLTYILIILPYLIIAMIVATYVYYVHGKAGGDKAAANKVGEAIFDTLMLPFSKLFDLFLGKDTDDNRNVGIVMSSALVGIFYWVITLAVINSSVSDEYYTAHQDSINELFETLDKWPTLVDLHGFTGAVIELISNHAAFFAHYLYWPMGIIAILFLMNQFIIKTTRTGMSVMAKVSKVTTEKKDV